ncbi:MAG TPA: tetratricopeptide repeat protein [Dokdonella sp.]|uniref:tetratricopeptide repeat protein n=1 Tax=Dokdonella sp. TaxID=2291710 RepID=UPI002D807205|nr:tetratricopeptide repeat protein [Dokdonella sp.]HET9032996.1 tetratricopeptide repeat protein [Dokdonella sp.]
MSEASTSASTGLDQDHLIAALREDPDAAIEAIRAAALTGEIAAQFLLGQMHCEGRGVALDASEGLHWYRLAANSGMPEAMNMVGRCHELGTGTVADAVLAAVWYRKSAQAGHDWGMYNYANLLATGRGVTESRSEALSWYRKAADLGHAKSMNLVGRYLEEGWEVAQDPIAASSWYRKSAEAGDFRGQASHAQILIEQGRVSEAVTWLQRAVDAGSPSFLIHIAKDLAVSPHPAVREIARIARERCATTDRLPGNQRNAPLGAV